MVFISICLASCEQKLLRNFVAEDLLKVAELSGETIGHKPGIRSSSSNSNSNKSDTTNADPHSSPTNLTQQFTSAIFCPHLLTV